MYDVAIVGAGPAGLSASVALACEGRSVCLLDRAYNVGGQIAHSHLVENVVGYSRGFSGEEFSEEAYNQAVNLGVDIMLGQEVLMLYGGPYDDGVFKLATDHIGTISARAILITVGLSPRPIPFDVLTPDCCVTNELQLLPAGPGEHVIVYGGGNSAGQAGVWYAKQGCKVTLLSRRPIQETMDGRWIQTLARYRVDNVVGTIQHICNDSVVFESSGVTQQLIPHTVHSFLGGEPTTSWLDGMVELDAHGYIVTDDLHCTATYGIYAAGDCVAGTVKRFTCAIGGATEAVHSVSQYLDASRDVLYS